MSEKQAAYNAGPAHPTSVERLCDALELDYAPAVYSTPALFDKAADKITALQYALDAAKAERDEITRDYDLEHNRANILASEIEPLRYELSGRKLEIIAVKQRLEEADARVAELYGKCNSFESLWLAAVKQRDEARAWARKLWREKQAEKLVCPACSGERYVIVDIMGYSNGRMQKCFVCNGTGKVTK